jgi:peptide chain release factor 2
VSKPNSFDKIKPRTSDSHIKDLRTNVEIGNTQSVLDGDLDEFISASLKQGV